MRYAGLRRCHNHNVTTIDKKFKNSSLLKLLSYKDEILLIPQQTDVKLKSFGMSAEG